jgi:hypothetical protein
LMLAMPELIAPLSLAMFLGVVSGIVQRAYWLVTALHRSEKRAS